MRIAGVNRHPFRRSWPIGSPGENPGPAVALMSFRPEQPQVSLLVGGTPVLRWRPARYRTNLACLCNSLHSSHE